MISCSQLVHRFEQFNGDCNALYHNWMDNLSQLSRQVSYGERISMYGYILDKIYGES